MAADATPHCEGCPVAADAVNSTKAAQWPSKCWGRLPGGGPPYRSQASAPSGALANTLS